MNERVEAVARGIHHAEALGPIEGPSLTTLAKAAIDASDAVMFSDEAVERFAIFLHYETAPLSARWEHMSEDHKQMRRDAARRMFAAVKGVGDE